jgi:hypothetical protein
MDELKVRFDAGDYQGVLRITSQSLALGGKAADGLDKHLLQTTRAEALLRLKQVTQSAQAFHQAAKLTDDHEKSATDLATEILLHQSKQQQYTPRIVPQGEKSVPIDVVNLAHRKLAMRALFSDEWAIAAPKIKAGKEATSLVVISTAVKAIQSQQLDLLDLVANGNDDQTKEAISKLRDHSAELISKALEKLGKREQEITSEANEIVHQQVMVPAPGGGFTPTDLPRRRGLVGDARQELDGISRAAAQIAAAAQQLVADLGDKTAAGDLLEQANDIVQRADKAIRADYSHA